MRVLSGPLTTRVDTTRLCICINLTIFKIITNDFFFFSILIYNAVITQTCITLLDVYIEKNLEYFIFRQYTEYATLTISNQSTKWRGTAYII
jgi:hypothetical protein